MQRLCFVNHFGSAWRTMYIVHFGVGLYKLVVGQTKRPSLRTQWVCLQWDCLCLGQSRVIGGEDKEGDDDAYVPDMHSPALSSPLQPSPALSSPLIGLRIIKTEKGIYKQNKISSLA